MLHTCIILLHSYKFWPPEGVQCRIVQANRIPLVGPIFTDLYWLDFYCVWKVQSLTNFGFYRSDMFIYVVTTIFILIPKYIFLTQPKTSPICLTCGRKTGDFVLSVSTKVSRTNILHKILSPLYWCWIYIISLELSGPAGPYYKKWTKNAVFGPF